MNEQEAREKIVKILEEAYEPIEYVDDYTHAVQIYFPSNEDVADTLIAAGIGDVSELQKECDSKEEAYNKCYFDFKHWKDKAKEYKHRVSKAERALRNLAQFCAKGAGYYLQSDETAKKREQELYDEWIKQAEKELAEEANND